MDLERKQMLERESAAVDRLNQLLGKTSSSTASCSNVPTELDVAEDKIRDLEALITVLRADIRELYSMRGEDELTAKYCNAILTATADI